MTRPSRTLPFFLLMLATAAQAAAPAPVHELGETMRPAEVRAGSLLLESEGGMRAAPTLFTDVEVRVTGMIARTRVVQRFHNPTADWVEGVYVFPLPERSAVDAMRMIVGDRVLEGEIQTKAEARATYARARSEGRKASLVEQERPNIFTTSVANLGPGQDLEVAIEYQEDLRYDAGRFSLRFPMVVGPRYIPGTAKVAGFGGSGWARDTDQVPDAARITPPVAEPRSGRTHGATVRVWLDAGFRLGGITSPSHAIRVSAEPHERYAVTLDAGSVPADSDFVLEWKPRVGEAPGAALFHEEWEGEHYVLLMVMPPDAEAAARARLPRETIYVIDTSGSMHGASIHQTRAALSLALERLQPGDSFNVIEFASSSRRLFPESRAAEPAALAQAQAWVRALEAGGGTEMMSALRAALSSEAEHSAVRQIVFITDGAVGNDDALFSFIRTNLGQSRLFTVGIGSAPNSHFMTKAAEFGRGTFTYVGSPSEVQTKMGELFAKLESPVLHDLDLAFDERHVEAWPKRIPDLYLGEPVLVAAKLRAVGGNVVLKGRRGADDFTVDLPIAGGAEESGVARLWARRKLASLMSSLQEGAVLEEVKQEVAALGLRHHLVTRWTSLVAVDVTPTAPVDAVLETRPLPTLLPKGWSLRHLFGGMDSEAAARAQANAPSPVAPVTPNGTATAAATPTAQPMIVTQGRLPQGATPAALLLWLGSVCLGGAATLWRLRRRA